MRSSVFNFPIRVLNEPFGFNDMTKLYTWIPTWFLWRNKLRTREINYLFNINKWPKDENTPNCISVEIHLPMIFGKVSCMLSGFWQIFKRPGKNISCTDIFINLVDKKLFHHGRFSKTPASVLNQFPFFYCWNETNHDDWDLDNRYFVRGFGLNEKPIWKY